MKTVKNLSRNKLSEEDGKLKVGSISLSKDDWLSLLMTAQKINKMHIWYK